MQLSNNYIYLTLSNKVLLDHWFLNQKISIKDYFNEIKCRYFDFL